MIVSLICLTALVQLTAPTPNPMIEVEVDKRGKFVIELFMKEAPRTAGHFQDLVNAKFFDGQLFHRKVDNFVLQGGDPDSRKMSVELAVKSPGEMGGTKGLGDGGSGHAIKFEKNDLTHKQGTLGIALEKPADDSGDSQYFINLKDNFKLNGKYVVFAKIASGWEIVQKCERGDRITKMSSVPPHRL